MEDVGKLVSRLGRTCFIQRTVYERIQTVVRARKPTHITEEKRPHYFLLKKNLIEYLSIMTEVKMSVAVTADVSVIRNHNTSWLAK
jgi:hypothetical protein